MKSNNFILTIGLLTGATRMAQDALTRAEYTEIKTLAQTIIREQEKEIRQMQEWKTKWSK